MMFIKCLISICFISRSSYTYASNNGRMFENELNAKLHIVRVIHLFFIAIYVEKIEIRWNTFYKSEKVR